MKNYHKHDVEKLKQFLEQPSAIPSMKNGEVLDFKYSPDDPETWEGVIFTSDKEKRISVLFWINKTYLTGHLDLSGCSSLSIVYLSNNRLKSVNFEDCKEVEQVICENNAIETLNLNGCVNIYTLKIKGNPLGNISMLAADRIPLYKHLDQKIIKPEEHQVSSILNTIKKNFSDQPDELTEFAIKTNSNFHSAEDFFKLKTSLKQRKSRLNNKFKFTEKRIKQLEAFNEWLTEKEKDAVQQARELEKMANEQLNRSSFTKDYEIEILVELFAPEKYDRFAELEGNPFYSFIPHLLYQKHQIDDDEHTDWVLDRNHNEFQHHKKHPLRNQHHCCLFHELYDHTPLAWQDILDIEEMWIEVNLTSQFMGKVQEHARPGVLK
ncbi:hypothetical protein QA597_10475 [Marinilabiliaceae bacterium ANBcel2]|nr:hypothetical protein [Marinilabiliaceae bacterium ANBcel2]